jgi:GAF domain-containing protein
VVSDITQDPRLSGLRPVGALQSIRFYAGEPVLYRGNTVGDVCVLDERPRQFFEEVAVLRDLAVVASELLESIEQQLSAQFERSRAEDFATASGDWFWELDAGKRYSWISLNSRR